jgi:zinc transporter ZupT
VEAEEESPVVKKHAHGHSHSLQMTAGTTRENILTKVYILLIAIVTHTVIIAFEYGTLHEDEDVTTLKILLAAFSVHQLFEGITVGFFVASVYDVVGIVNVGYLTMLFALSFPVGVILGKNAVI